MNNAICVLIDSVMWDYIGTKKSKVSSTPFIDSLKGESVVANNLFSYGPYTNAATRSLYTGRPALDDFGYYFQLNTSPVTHYKPFHDAGYETYGFYYPYYIIGKDIKEDIDHSIYIAGFVFNSEWGGIYKHYSSLLKNRDLNDIEKALLKERTKLMFDAWIGFYNDLIEDKDTGILLNDLITKYDVNESLSILESEQAKFINNPDEYIICLLKQGRSHSLAKLDKLDVDELVDRTYLNKEIYLRYRLFFEKASRNNKKANKDLRPSFKRVIWGLRRLIKTRNKNEIFFILNYFLCRNSIEKLIEDSRKHWQDVRSARVQLEHAAEILSRRQSEKPFYISLHFLEPHNEITFFSFDIKDKTVHEEEFKMLDSFVDELGTGFSGNIAYLLSIRYVDYYLSKFCDFLRNNNLWDKTSILLVADHGSSYSFVPLHNQHVNCFDKECYHVPMVIRHPGFEGKEINGYYNSKDVFPTFLDVLGIKQPSEMTGVSMIDDALTSKDYVMTEYMGPGCPDMSSKPIWFSIRDDRYVVAYKVCALDPFENGVISEVYDLRRDPDAIYNVVDRVSIDKILYLLNEIRNRHQQIQRETIEFLARYR